MEIKIYVILEEEKNAGLIAQFLNLSKKRKKNHSPSFQPALGAT